MSLSLDDLGRAAYTAVEDFYFSYTLKKWDELGPDSRSVDRARHKGEMKASALAAVERFVAALDDANNRGSMVWRDYSARFGTLNYVHALTRPLAICRAAVLAANEKEKV